jgi:hypothetical protein
MKESEHYQQTVLSRIEKVKASGDPAVIFGAGRAGWYIMKVLEKYGVPIAAFCDNNPEKQTTYCDYKVLSAQDVARKHPGAHIFLGIFVPCTAGAVQRQLQDMQFRYVHCDMAAFLFVYFVAVAERSCDRNVLARSIHVLFENYLEGAIHYGHTKDGCYVSPFVTSVITQKCSLRCRDCAQLIPYYKAPVHFPTESVIEDLKQYAKAFDVVPEISLHGGEPFLHPELKRICREAASISNVVFISFVTNGTILLPEETLQEFSACGADVNQSGGYGLLSRKKDDLSEFFRSHGIYSETMFCSPTEMWVQAPPYRKHSRPAEENNRLYKGCVATKTCCQIMNGELHRCALSMHGSHQGLFQKFERDYVPLHGPGVSDSDLSARIRAFLDRDEALAVCDYCDPEGGVMVPPAIQLSKR